MLFIGIEFLCYCVIELRWDHDLIELLQSYLEISASLLREVIVISFVFVMVIAHVTCKCCSVLVLSTIKEKV